MGGEGDGTVVAQNDDLEDKRKKCRCGHPLQFCAEFPYEGSGKRFGRCDECRSVIFQNDKNPGWHCEQCKYDRCKECYGDEDRPIPKLSTKKRKKGKTCPAGHPLQFTRACESKYTSGLKFERQCDGDECGAIIFANDDSLGWKCEQCTYDLCTDCYGNVIGEDTRVDTRFKCTKGHPLLYSSKSPYKGSGRCNRCATSIYSDYNNEGPGWHCKECHYDICKKCHGNEFTYSDVIQALLHLPTAALVEEDVLKMKQEMADMFGSATQERDKEEQQEYLKKALEMIQAIGIVDPGSSECKEEEGMKGGYVSFIFRPNLDASDVRLAGSFTDWDHEPLAMTQDGPVWTVSVQLAPGDHQYKYIVDGTMVHGPAWTVSVQLAPGDHQYKYIMDGTMVHGPVWTVSVQLAPGDHQYKYIVDGTMVHDQGAPFSKNEKEELTNVITVGEKHPDEAKEMKCTNGHILTNSARLTLWICDGCHCATNTVSGSTFRGTKSASKNIWWPLPPDAKRYRCQTCDHDICENCFIANGKKNHANCSLRAIGIPSKQLLKAMARAPEDGIEDWRCKRCKKRCLETPIFWWCEGCRQCRMCNQCFEAEQK